MSAFDHPPGGTGQDCAVCHHPYDAHVVVGVGGDDGGIVLCPHAGCDCLQMWAVDLKPVPPLPSNAAINRVRFTIQSGAL